MLHAAPRTIAGTATLQQSLVFASSAMPKLQACDMLTPDGCKAPTICSGFLPLIESGADKALITTLYTSQKIQTCGLCAVETDDSFCVNIIMQPWVFVIVAESRYFSLLTWN